MDQCSPYRPIERENPSPIENPIQPSLSFAYSHAPPSWSRPGREFILRPRVFLSQFLHPSPAFSHDLSPPHPSPVPSVVRRPSICALQPSPVWGLSLSHHASSMQGSGSALFFTRIQLRHLTSASRDGLPALAVIPPRSNGDAVVGQPLQAAQD
ncbi:hypothetical protein AAHA92_09491 [Salvia divinorum]|uniref:Uncharacterized protein n=1 Tax=Salvia divinorum TaxID=28513 RepID=A0ABD1HRM4_SALDI